MTFSDGEFFKLFERGFLPAVKGSKLGHRSLQCQRLRGPSQNQLLGSVHHQYIWNKIPAGMEYCTRSRGFSASQPLQMIPKDEEKCHSQKKAAGNSKEEDLFGGEWTAHLERANLACQKMKNFQESTGERTYFPTFDLEKAHPNKSGFQDFSLVLLGHGSLDRRAMLEYHQSNYHAVTLNMPRRQYMHALLKFEKCIIIIFHKVAKNF